MPHRNWLDLTSEDFTKLDAARTIVVLPVAAVEQHGPHLPVSTDTTIADGMIAEVQKHPMEDADVLFLPVQCVGKSNEHIRSPGTLTLGAETAIRAWTEIGESIARAGLRKLVLVNSHGGNVDVLSIVARELRLRCQMLCVHTHWAKFGLPENMFGEEEIRFGIHAGDIETSLMLHFRPDLVKMNRLENFVSSGVAMEKDFAILRPGGPAPFGWIAQDLHSSGAVGNASLATAQKGSAIAALEAKGFVALLADMAKFDLTNLA